MPIEPRDYQLYFEAMQRRHTPTSWDDLLRELGEPAEVRQRRMRIEMLIRRDEHRVVIWAFLKQTALAFITIVGLLATFKAVLPAGWQPW